MSHFFNWLCLKSKTVKIYLYLASDDTIKIFSLRLCIKFFEESYFSSKIYVLKVHQTRQFFYILIIYFNKNLIYFRVQIAAVF